VRRLFCAVSVPLPPPPFLLMATDGCHFAMPCRADRLIFSQALPLAEPDCPAIRLTLMISARLFRRRLFLRRVCGRQCRDFAGLMLAA